MVFALNQKGDGAVLTSIAVELWFRVFSAKLSKLKLKVKVRKVLGFKQT